MKTCPFTASISQEGKWFVVQCLEVDVASQGKSEDEAIDNLREALELYFETPHPTVMPKLRKFKNDRLTIEEMEQKYPDEWLLIVDYELSENTELLSGRLVAHSKSRKEIRDISMNYAGRIAVHSTRKTPEGVGYLL